MAWSERSDRSESANADQSRAAPLRRQTPGGNPYSRRNARLNAVARAERAANPNMLYLFNGDMFSPSLMSGFDQGAHTVELCNIAPPDLFIPGKGDRLHFDLPSFCQRQLTGAGLGSVENLGLDTCALEETYFSNRRRNLRGEADYGRNASVIVITD